MKQIILKSIIAAWLLIVVMPMMAQNDDMMDKYAKLYNEHENLKGRVNELEEQLKDTVLLINRYEEKLDEQQEQHERELREKERELNREISKLAKAIKELKDENKKIVEGKDQKVVNELNAQINNLTEDTLTLRKQLRDKDTMLENNKKDLANQKEELNLLRPFRQHLLAQMRDTVDQWLKAPFSELSLDAVEQSLADCQKYGRGEEGFRQLEGQLKPLKDDLNLFFDARNLLDFPYDEEKKTDVRQRLKALKTKYAGKQQLPEVEDVDELLRTYEGNVLVFQQLIADVDKGIKTERELQSAKAALATLNSLLEDEDMKVYIESINTIPYLKKLLDKYLSDLRKDPLSHSSVEPKVMQMLPE